MNVEGPLEIAMFYYNVLLSGVKHFYTFAEILKFRFNEINSIYKVS